MIVVDSSVWIGHHRNANHAAARSLRAIEDPQDFVVGDFQSAQNAASIQPSFQNIFGTRDLKFAVTQVAAGPLLLVVNPAVKAQNVKELIALAKSSSKKLNYASAGVGSGFHLAAEKLKTAAGVDMVHVPYKGGAPATADVVAGHVDLMIGSSVVAPHVAAKRLRLLGVTSGERSSFLPEVPTVAEQGLPGYEVNTWFGIFAPANTPKPIVDKLAREIQAIVRAPEYAKHVSKFMLTPVGNSPAEFEAIVQREVLEWIKAAKEANIQPTAK